MSCKVFNAARTARPLLLRSVSGEPYISAGTMVLPNSAAQDGVQVAELHARVGELERTLQREVRAAHDQGFREGEHAGREAAAQEVEKVVQRLSASLTDLAGLRARIRRETEADLVKLSLAIARRILLRELSVDPEAMHGVVKAALEKVNARDVVKIRVHPGQQPMLRRQLDRGAATTGLEVTADPSLRPGDVIVETKRGDLDASIETQLGEIERGFADRLRS